MFEKKEKNNLSTYKGAMGELSNRELALSGWWVKNRIMIGKIGIGFLVAWCIITIGYSFFQWGKYFIFDYNKDEIVFYNQVVTMPNYESIHALYEARELQVLRPQVFESAPGRYDFVTDISNMNDRWVAIVTYKYIHSRGETEPKQTILLPLTKRPVVALGYEADSFPSNPRLLITNTEWVKINAHVVPDVVAFMEERLGFVYENVDFTSASASADVSAHSLTFDLINDSAYSYWQPLFLAELFDQNRRVGLIPVTVDQLQSGETRNIDVRSLASQLSASDVVIHPVVNVFDRREFMDPGS